MTHGVSLPGIADNGWPKLGREIRFWAELRCKRMVIEQDDIGTRREGGLDAEENSRGTNPLEQRLHLLYPVLQAYDIAGRM